MLELKIGIIGVGLLGNTHLMALQTIIEEEYYSDQAQIQVVALCDIDEHVLKQRAEMYEIPDDYCFSDYHDLITCEEINTVYIVTPTSLHFEIFEVAAKAGKNIFCEKPLTDTIEKMEKMVTLRDENNIFCQVGLVLRNNPVFWYFKQLLNDPENQKSWGKLQNIIFRDDQDKPYTGSGTHPSTWRKDPNQAFHGTLFEHSIHDIDIMQYWFGPVQDVYAQVKFFANISPIEDSVSANFELINGATASLNSIWHNVKHDERDFQFFFENAFVQMNFDMTHANLMIHEVGKRRRNIKAKEADEIYRKTLGIEEHSPDWLQGYGYENEAFIRTLINNLPPSPSLEDAIAAHRVVEACYQSSKEKTRIILE